MSVGSGEVTHAKNLPTTIAFTQTFQESHVGGLTCAYAQQHEWTIEEN